ncbi:MAG: hypothetical protein A2504_03245 [Bdellovibrionales bacterium RIFOXYD12_FULL_39_22]|nr:MAG: hypothetical protein A2385_15655 [Bdellovibrionales bacterium RIFOXYB1_FULL_39_21]OFZ41542.1 MAG: hypothetical protein A2485_02345 [Bdellovibrionales bacterium RIFOXYC12_FULL_39_17]OFZ45855.1 MAG: hypothetical protein A2404_12710 [Bdellovibrionales bacterium RIFOXYC1_FULL_39_130]OFZ72794.1 MAG: hypothetical protein A2451_13100 [Bdellovibrionales bacterium RIFOXYC2_FULL_39_8]OFZ74787.1 MAG: hypothetical protein A2560_10140 [Bdellovibrionales bacterium RIFOXYD1_FULL_39_84]OFZ92647.1 MAG:
MLAQSVTDYELVIIDNCSTDNTRQVIAEFSDPRIRVIHNKTNIGFAANWNKTLSEIRGKYYKLLPADDLLLPDCIEKQVAILENPKFNNISLVCGHRDIIGPTGKTILKLKNPLAKGTNSARTALKKCIYRGTNIFGEPGNIMIRSELITKTHGYTDKYNFVIDLDFYLQILKYGDCYNIPETIGQFRISSDSESTSIGRLQANQFTALMEHLRREKHYNISIFELFIAKLMARINGFLRRIVYKFLL